MKYPKKKRYENPRYLDSIRTKCCLVCDSGETVPHHVVSVGAGGSDLLTIPLCADHHNLGGDSVHRLGKTTFPEKHGLNIDAEMVRLLTEYIEKEGQ